MIQEEDFRTELYKKYVTTYKKFIGDEDITNNKSVYGIFEKRFSPLLIEYSKDASIIEIGCGTGLLLGFLKQQGYQNLYGIDISEEQIKKAKAKGLNADVKSVHEFFKTNDKKYDIVFALDFIEHFHKEELLNLLSEIKGIMKQTGLLIIRTPNGDGLLPGRVIYGDFTHLTIFNSNSLTQILRISGFNKINFYETGPTNKNLKGFVRLILWRAVKVLVKAVKIIETGRADRIITQDLICTARFK